MTQCKAFINHFFNHFDFTGKYIPNDLRNRGFPSTTRTKVPMPMPRRKALVNSWQTTTASLHSATKFEPKTEAAWAPSPTFAPKSNSSTQSPCASISLPRNTLPSTTSKTSTNPSSSPNLQPYTLPYPPPCKAYKPTTSRISSKRYPLATSETGFCPRRSPGH